MIADPRLRHPAGMQQLAGDQRALVMHGVYNYAPTFRLDIGPDARHVSATLANSRVDRPDRRCFG
jgi:hypothetical protein